MLRRFLKDDIDGVRVTIFKLAYIHDTTHNSHKTFGKFFHDVQYAVEKPTVGTSTVGGSSEV